MRTGEVMTRQPRFIRAEATVREAARAMHDWAVGFLPVRRGETLVGVITDRDLALRPAAGARPYETTLVGEIMTPHAHAVRESTPLSAAARAMQQKRVRRLLVLDDDEHLAGVVSLGDLAKRGRDATLPAAVLRTLQAPRRLAPTDRS
jgi:CBS domain-containing protein